MRALPIFASLALVACSPPPDDHYTGYVEGEFTYVSAPFAGYLAELRVARGDRVAVNQPLFVLEAETEAQALAEAEARALAARAEADNLQDARRTDEIATLRAALQAAETALALARSRLQREQDLLRRGFVSAARVDELQAQVDQAVAQRSQARAQLALARAPVGRSEEARAAEAGVAAAEARVAQQRWLLGRREATAPVAGEVVDTYFRRGEWVAAGQPVASLLPPEGRRLRFFVPERELARLHPGQQLEAHCDGCPAPLTATIDFIAPQAEYTPPVIYSQGSREKLVFRVEAVPTAGAPALPPGLPVDVRRPN